MTAVLHVSLAPALKREPVPSANPVLDVHGPLVCIGAERGEDNLAIPIKPGAATLFGPRGACLINAHGPLWISDTGHHRLLGWAQIPNTDGVPADWVIGQADFTREGRNAKSTPSAVTLNVPTGICKVGDGLAVADAWNHRVLIWQTLPTSHNVPADVVLGQVDFSCVESNRGHANASADSLFWPYGVHWDGNHLWVADSGNRRVLMWHGIPRQNGLLADLVLGQAGFECRDENGGGEPTAGSMRWPHAICRWGEKLCVTDAGNNRIQVWDRLPGRNNAPCDWLLGQCESHLVDHNQSLYWPSAASLHMPYGITATRYWCIAADTANSRLIAWHASEAFGGAAASALTGQAEFNAKGDNAWRSPTRCSLSWPYGISAHGEMAVIADSGNNRVLLWRLAGELLA